MLNCYCGDVGTAPRLELNEPGCIAAELAALQMYRRDAKQL